MPSARWKHRDFCVKKGGKGEVFQTRWLGPSVWNIGGALVGMKPPNHFLVHGLASLFPSGISLGNPFSYNSCAHNSFLLRFFFDLAISRVFLIEFLQEFLELLDLQEISRSTSPKTNPWYSLGMFLRGLRPEVSPGISTAVLPGIPSGFHQDVRSRFLQEFLTATPSKIP